METVSNFGTIFYIIWILFSIRISTFIYERKKISLDLCLFLCMFIPIVGIIICLFFKPRPRRIYFKKKSKKKIPAFFMNDIYQQYLEKHIKLNFQVIGYLLNDAFINIIKYKSSKYFVNSVYNKNVNVDKKQLKIIYDEALDIFDYLDYTYDSEIANSNQAQIFREYCAKMLKEQIDFPPFNETIDNYIKMKKLFIENGAP